MPSRVSFLFTGYSIEALQCRDNECPDAIKLSPEGKFNLLKIAFTGTLNGIMNVVAKLQTKKRALKVTKSTTKLLLFCSIIIWFWLNKFNLNYCYYAGMANL
jgi:hypothetical protein